MKYSILLVLLIALSSCSSEPEPNLTSIEYQQIPGNVLVRTSIIKHVTESPKSPSGLYAFVSKKNIRKEYAVPDATHEMLILRFDNGQTFTLMSCHRLFEQNKNTIATDHGIEIKESVSAKDISSELTKFKFMFDEIIRMNALDKSPNMPQQPTTEQRGDKISREGN